jgi:hypothetical protein
MILESRWQRPPPLRRDSGSALAGRNHAFQAARIMIGLRAGNTPRRFTVKASRFEAYCKAHPDYAREAKALLSENLKASNLRKGALKL